MALNKGIWDPKLRSTNMKGTNLKSLTLYLPYTLSPNRPEVEKTPKPMAPPLPRQPLGGCEELDPAILNDNIEQSSAVQGWGGFRI